MASLFVIQGHDQGQRYRLEGDFVRIGRDPSNQIRLHDTEVSRRHAELLRDENGFRIRDLDSSNGTYVNSRKIQEHPLQSGDRIQLGRTLMLYTESRPQRSPESAPRDVDIVPQSVDEYSQIVQAMSHEEGSRIVSASEASLSPWMARIRSNLQVMYRTALTVSHTLDIDQLLDRIMQLIFEWVEADRGCIMLVDRQSGQLIPKVRRDRQGTTDQERIRISATILDYVSEKQEGVLTSNAREDQRWESAASIVKLGIREAICVPMRGRYGSVGVIYIDTFTPPARLLQEGKANRFTDEHLKLMMAIGHQAALAIEDTHYYSALVEAERLAAIGQTIASLSHHIKNILQGIRGGSFLIEEGLAKGDPEVARTGWRIVEKNQERISALVMDMLTFSKERQPELVPSDLNALVGEVLELIQARADEAGVRLVDQRQPEIPLVLFDGEGLHRAILNVVTNAIDACQDVSDPVVTISTHWDPDRSVLTVMVTDNGEGIPPERCEAIFSLFESNKGNRGTGLGLPVSRKILREHGGDIHVESKRNEGSRFILFWPATLAETELPTEENGKRTVVEPRREASG